MAYGFFCFFVKCYDSNGNEIVMGILLKMMKEITQRVSSLRFRLGFIEKVRTGMQLTG